MGKMFERVSEEIAKCLSLTISGIALEKKKTPRVH